MSKLYSFDKVGGFSVVVECVGEEDLKPVYEGIVFLHAVQNPHECERGDDAEVLREKLIAVAKEHITNSEDAFNAEQAKNGGMPYGTYGDGES